MKTKPLTLLLALTFLFLFSGSVFGDDFQDADDSHDAVIKEKNLYILNGNQFYKIYKRKVLKNQKP